MINARLQFYIHEETHKKSRFVSYSLPSLPPTLPPPSRSTLRRLLTLRSVFVLTAAPRLLPDSSSIPGEGGGEQGFPLAFGRKMPTFCLLLARQDNGNARPLVPYYSETHTPKKPCVLPSRYPCTDLNILPTLTFETSKCKL